MRAFIATLDAMLAIVLIAGVVSGTLYMLHNRQGMDWDDIYLQRIGNDVVTVLEKTDAIDLYVLNSDEGLIRNVTAMSPSSVCVKVSLTEKGQPSSYYSYTKPGCDFGRRQAVVRRQVMVYDSSHVLQKWVILKGQVWYR